MKKLLSLLIISLLFANTASAQLRVFDSRQVGTNPVNGYVLQTDGSYSTWVSTTTLGFAASGGGGVSFGKTWEIDANGFLAPTTTIAVRFPLGFLSQASSTINANATTTGMQGVGSLFINNEKFTDLTGTGLSVVGGALTADLGTSISPGELTGSGSIAANQMIYTTATGLAFAGVSTSTPTLASEFSYSGTLGSFVGGSSGTLSVATNGLALNKLAQIGANTILGNPTGSTANIQAFATSSLGIALSDTTGTLSVSRGGTGATSFVDNRVLTGNGTSAINDEANLTFDGSLLTITGNSTTTGNATFGSSGAQRFEIRPNNSNANTTYPYLRIDSSGNTVLEPGSSGVLYLNYDHGPTNVTSFNGDQVRILGNGNVGIGSTTPGTKLSIGNTGPNTINISPTATSTFGSGIDIRTGCFALNGSCLTSSAGNTFGVETPTGTINGSNAAFTTASNPLLVQLNGAYQTAGGVDYTLTGSGPYTITFVQAPVTGSVLRSIYSTSGTSPTLAGTTGSIQFNNGGVFGSSASLFWDNNNNRFGLGTSSPAFLGDIFSSATSTVRLDSNSTTRGGCLIMKDSDGVGYTYITAANGVLSASTNPCN